MIKYCYPNLPTWVDHTTVDNYSPHYIAEVKKNGWRCLAWRKKEGLELWTRRHTLITDPLPITRGILMELPVDTMIDGELIDKRTKDTKDHYYAFDILFLSNVSVMGKQWLERRQRLEDTWNHFKLWGIELSQPIQLGFSTLYKQAVENGDEGIVIKGTKSRYVVDLKSCPHNKDWYKAKTPEKCFVR
jgi:ATP-dependent DNA ligase